MKRKIKMMADYECYPLWLIDTNQFMNIDPVTLPLSQETVKLLEEWAVIYDSTLKLDDPASSGFLNYQEQEAFEQQGVSLWKQLRQELSSEYEVFYFSELKRKLLTYP